VAMCTPVVQVRTMVICLCACLLDGWSGCWLVPRHEWYMCGASDSVQALVLQYITRLCCTSWARSSLTQLASYVNFYRRATA
jgi:hypothetical protein